MASQTEIVESLKLRMFRWRETMLLDRFSKCGVLLFRMKRTTISSVFEESDVQLFDLLSHPEHLQQMIYVAVVATVCCMELRINLDCAACCRKMKRVLLRMKEIEQHMIERQSCRVSVCGRFDPGDVAIKIRKKMNRRVDRDGQPE
nr:heavy metal-associated isoprenylated plant protein 6 isoform X2 [Ipomoea batatas]